MSVYRCCKRVYVCACPCNMYVCPCVPAQNVFYLSDLFFTHFHKRSKSYCPFAASNKNFSPHNSNLIALGGDPQSGGSRSGKQCARLNVQNGRFHLGTLGKQLCV